LARSNAPAAPPALAPGETRLVYFSAAGRLGALRHDSRGWVLHPDLAPLREIEERLRLFHYQMEVRTADLALLPAHREVIGERTREHLEHLGRLLIDPVRAGGGPTPRLRIAPHGPLFRVPFHALPWHGTPLAEACEVSIDAMPGLPLSRPGPERSGT